jgi:hypothetical protein
VSVVSITGLFVAPMERLNPVNVVLLPICNLAVTIPVASLPLRPEKFINPSRSAVTWMLASAPGPLIMRSSMIALALKVALLVLKAEAVPVEVAAALPPRTPPVENANALDDPLPLVLLLKLPEAGDGPSAQLTVPWDTHAVNVLATDCESRPDRPQQNISMLNKVNHVLFLISSPLRDNSDLDFLEPFQARNLACCINTPPNIRKKSPIASN